MLNAMLCLSLANTSWVVYRYYITVKLDFFCMDDWQTLKTLKRKTIVVWTALKTSGSLREAFRKQTKSNRCLECVQLLGRAQHTHMRGWDQQWSPHPTSPTSPTSSTSSTSPLSQGELSFHRVMLAWLPPLLSASSAVPKSAPPPCVIGLQWSMAADEVLWHTDRNTRGSGTNKKKWSAFLSLGLFADAISLRGSRCCTHSRVRAHKHAAFSPPVPLLSDLIFFFFFPGSRL